MGIEHACPLQARQVHKPGEVNISGYFPAEVKAALRMVQAKTGKNVKQCLAEALQDFEGTLVVVAHDRHLLKVTADTLWLVADGEVKEFDGDFDTEELRLMRIKFISEVAN